MVCGFCCAPFTYIRPEGRPGRPSLYCDAECKRAAARKRSRERYQSRTDDRTAAERASAARRGAEARWANTSSEERSTQMSLAARARLTAKQIEKAAAKRAELQSRREAPCPYCGDPVGRPGRVKCSKPECNLAHQAARMRDYWQTNAGREARGRGKAQYREHRKALGLPAHPYNESSKARYQRRRAAKRGVGAEVFLNSEIFERDGWVCGICTEPVDRDLAYPDPMSVSVDHIIPLSLGGEHSRANTRCSHLTCNVQRGNRAA